MRKSKAQASDIEVLTRMGMKMRVKVMMKMRVRTEIRLRIGSRMIGRIQYH
jgi:hypothetical protein